MLIEIRPFIEKYKLKGKIRQVKQELSLRRTHRVPHLSLIYEFRPKIPLYDIARIISQTAEAYPNMKLEYAGWDLRQGANGYVFSFNIVPNEQLKQFRYKLYQNLKHKIFEGSTDARFNSKNADEFWFHSAIAFHMNEYSAEKVRNFISGKETGILSKLSRTFTSKSHSEVKPLYLEGRVVRIPILNRGRIAYEYDTLLDKILTRQEALSKYYKVLTLAKYREVEGIEVKAPLESKRKNTWLISDTHFDHGNIIYFSSRPFTDVREMNKVLLSNWNNTVSKGDTIYFLGDLALGRERDYPKRAKTYLTKQWQDRLNGDKIFINGNHDPKDFGEKSKTISYQGTKFLLVHDPNPEAEDNSEIKKEIEKFDGWIIHGHTHNNDLVNTPFINFKKKRINVSVELIKYRPINIDSIIDLIKSPQKENILYYKSS